eukprot:TRINITY_DN7167_c0_g1_i1.p1 TRINITY_DN7167_c0_g1~~TRINITY_DN7167_c0_g1_i1.p1  ORF type:complete len:389 (-),score=69.18 TRINITY_DN7167_c0_g1_i1:4-1137(-)
MGEVETSAPHRRFNVLTGEWILVSPHRARRPWLGAQESPSNQSLPEFDEKCYLCPGNKRNLNAQNEKYVGTYVFDNDFPALLSPNDPFWDVLKREKEENKVQGITDTKEKKKSKLFQIQQEYGVCKVICFSPRHDLSLPLLSLESIEGVINTWCFETRSISKKEFISYVQVFENKGDAMGCSNPHPHCQIWASHHVPNEVEKEKRAQKEYFETEKKCLLCDYVREERESGERVVLSNDSFTVLVPYWAIWPFETLLVSNEHISSFMDLEDQEDGRQKRAKRRRDLAEIMKKLTVKYDNLFQTSFPYSMGFHQAPLHEPSVESYWHFHAHYYPPLLRSATVKKFMVGFELLANAQRDLTAETAATRLLSLPDIHYTSK